jgi:hypothetical protein
LPWWREVVARRGLREGYERREGRRVGEGGEWARRWGGGRGWKGETMKREEGGGSW